MGDIERYPDGTSRADNRVVVRVAPRIADVPAADWNACAAGGSKLQAPSIRPPNPLVSHAFLMALEESGSATRETGWLPQHFLLEDAGGMLLGCMPCYLKAHSQGEYVFDHGWADAYMRAGGRYYPKLQVSVPFTPVTGKRVLVRPGANSAERGALLLQAAMQIADRLGVSSLHITFPTRAEWQLAGEIGLLQRTDQRVVKVCM